MAMYYQPNTSTLSANLIILKFLIFKVSMFYGLCISLKYIKILKVFLSTFYCSLYFCFTFYWIRVLLAFLSFIFFISNLTLFAFVFYVQFSTKFSFVKYTFLLLLICFINLKYTRESSSLYCLVNETVWK